MFSLILLIYFLSGSSCSELLSRQKRVWIIESFEIEEEHPGPFPFELGRVDIEREYKVFFDLFGQGVDETPKGVFSIDKESGTIYVHKAVDYEEWTNLKLRFEAKRPDSSVDTQLGIVVAIRDINDSPPRFHRDLYKININENTTQGTHLLTVLAHDPDQQGTPNSSFNYSIKSVTPNNTNIEFFVQKSGEISFKGCLDYEVAKTVTVLVEARDHGDMVSLSSSTEVLIEIEDGNNHLPIISGQTGSGKVKENESGVSPLRLQVTDKDSINTMAWKAKYTIHNDDGGNFKIETDPETNDGILTVVKPLDYEERATRELVISVENEAPYFFCKVKERTSDGLWKVESDKGDGDGQPQSTKVIIKVEDVNDAPEFPVSARDTILKENAPVGTWVKKVTAVDSDSTFARDIVYRIGNDPAGWVKVDPHTGDITTVKIPDRESPHVVDGIYTILLHAIDDGKPPTTGTATLQIHVVDMNDNLPQLEENFVSFCESDIPVRTNVSAFDLDGTPFGGPFSFQLLGNVKGKWKLDPIYGFTAGLVKEAGVQTGLYMIDLKISDLQGKSSIHSLNVKVCICSVTHNCISQSKGTRVNYGAAGITFLSLVLLLLLLLCTFTFSCKEKFNFLQIESSFGETLVKSNTETPGSDCKSPATATMRSSGQIRYLSLKSKNQLSSQVMQQSGIQKPSVDYNRTFYLFTDRGSQFENKETRNVLMQSNISSSALQELIHRRLSSLPEEENYMPDVLHYYEEEEESDIVSDFEEIIHDEDAIEEVLSDLGPRFKLLASICKHPEKHTSLHWRQQAV